MLHAGKDFHKEAKNGESCGRNGVQGPDTTGDLSLCREAYQKQADIITAKILHQLCWPQVTGTESEESHRAKAGGGEGMGERELRAGCSPLPPLAGRTSPWLPNCPEIANTCTRRELRHVRTV